MTAPTPSPRRSSSGDSGTQVLHLERDHHDKALSTVLKGFFPEASWGEVKRWIARRLIQVNGNLCLDPGRRMRAGDVVKRLAQPLPKPVDADDIRVVHIDPHLIIVEKPAGITSVRHVAEKELPPRRKQLQPTLDELLPQVLARELHLPWPAAGAHNRGGRKRPGKGGRHGNHKQEIVSRKRLPPALRVYPVHRLDRDTSGLMVFARTSPSQQRLMAMFRRHAVRREYLAVCHGCVEPQTIDTTLVRDRGDGLRGTLLPGMVDPRPDLAQRAITHVIAAEPIGSPPAFSLIRCQLETGRTHQIRIHLAEIGHPICGEPLYRRLPDGTTIADTSGAPRQALHAHRMALHHPMTGERLEFHMPMPRDLAAWMLRLRRQEEQGES
ncbi:MAG: hypothetical protein KatS3mg111_3341 [Pirellulaceae bacterium]|nr:MAG: hypothetical protein KatS3mg111_3341 [Pirellulaceae bacterium]